MTRNDENFSIPPEIAENLNEFFPDFGDLSHEEFIQHQESVYQSLKQNDSIEERISDHGQSSDSSQFSGQERESSRRASFHSQLALDEDLAEALARSLQDFEDGFDDRNISQSASAATENREVSSRETPATSINQNIGEDAIDPDSMTYEQLQLLGESVGSENKGLSKDLISRLPNFKYKRGFFSKKNEETCMVCHMIVESGEYLTSLPCTHRYHSKCITKWLVISKKCPVCLNEVSED